MTGPQETPLKEKELIKEGDEAPLNKGDVQPLNPGEKAEAATERLTKTYADKGNEELALAREKLTQKEVRKAA